MTTTDTAAPPHPASGLLDPTAHLRWIHLAPAFVLIAIYSMLSYIGFVDQAFFYDSMEIPVPSNEFLLYSWAGKNTAVLLGLVIATVSRLRVLVLTAIAMLFTMQMGDVNAGAQSGVNVFVTWIAFGLTVAQLGIVLVSARERS